MFSNYSREVFLIRNPSRVRVGNHGTVARSGINGRADDEVLTVDFSTTDPEG